MYLGCLKFNMFLELLVVPSGGFLRDVGAHAHSETTY
jgi:hypothetical protein